MNVDNTNTEIAECDNLVNMAICSDTQVIDHFNKLLQR